MNAQDAFCYTLIYGHRVSRVGVRILCSKIRELCYALMLTIYASKQNNFYSMLSGSALVLLKLSEASSPESSTSSPSLETVVNVVPEAKLSDRLLILQPGLLCLAIFSYRVTWKLHMRNTHGAKKEPNYAGIMLDALKGQLCLKLCWHNIRTPSHGGATQGGSVMVRV